VPDRITAAWARIDAWLAAHAPPTLALFAGPASDHAVRAAASTIGVELPDELVASLRCHDGLLDWANALPEAPPIGARQIADVWRDRMHIAADAPPFEGEPWWHPLWIPYADADGDVQVIDLRPGPYRGRTGMAFHDGSGDFSRSWPSLGVYLDDVVRALYEGGGVGVWHPYLTSRREMWWDLPGRQAVGQEPLSPAPVGL
jgi:cell wall assembly regulator SMI1